MAKSEWKVQSNYIAGKGHMYRAYRILDTDQPVHSGNIEAYGGYCEDRDAVQETVDRLNAQEGMRTAAKSKTKAKDTAKALAMVMRGTQLFGLC